MLFWFLCLSDRPNRALYTMKELWLVSLHTKALEYGFRFRTGHWSEIFQTACIDRLRKCIQLYMWVQTVRTAVLGFSFIWYLDCVSVVHHTEATDLMIAYLSTGWLVQLILIVDDMVDFFGFCFQSIWHLYICSLNYLCNSKNQQRYYWTFQLQALLWN